MVEQIPNQAYMRPADECCWPRGMHALCPVSIRQTGQSGANEPLVRKLTQPAQCPDCSCDVWRGRVESNGLYGSLSFRFLPRSNQGIGIKKDLGGARRGLRVLGRHKILGARTGRAFCHVCETERESSSVTGGNTYHGHNPAMAVGYRLAMAESSMMISTRRFFCRPSAVLLSAAGVVSPRP
jgi:hypothetical protein